MTEYVYAAEYTLSRIIAYLFKVKLEGIKMSDDILLEFFDEVRSKR